MSTLRLTGLADVKLKQLIWPALWCVLVVWFLTDTLNLSALRNSSIDSTAVGTGINGSWSPSNQLPSYYGSPIDSGDGLRVADNSAMSLGFVTANISTTTKAAVIIETRRSGQVIPLILHFAAVLGPDWPIVIYTSPENFGSFSTSHSLLRLQNAGRIVVRALAEGVYFPNWDSVSGFLTSKWMWEDLAPAEHILIFQSDSVLCANSVRSMEDFFEWDLIGAPIMPNFGIGYNGGLSLRKRSSILRILDEWDWKESTGMRAEDQWFYFRMNILKERDEADGIEDGVKLPSMEIARTFAVETIDYPNPLGLHQPTRFISEKDHMLPLDKWCPEYKLARTDRINE